MLRIKDLLGHKVYKYNVILTWSRMFMKKSAVDILLISINSIFKSMSLPKQPARAQATVHKIMILLSKQKRLPQNSSNTKYLVIRINTFYISATKPPEFYRSSHCLRIRNSKYRMHKIESSIIIIFWLFLFLEHSFQVNMHFCYLYPCF